MTGRGSDAEAGFTLVEMLVGLAVTGMAAVILAIGIGQMTLALKTATRSDRHLDAVATAQFTLRRRIEQTFPARDTQAIETVDFAGKDKSLDFLAPAPDRTGPNALHRYRLKLARDGTVTLYDVTSLTTAIDVREPATLGWAATPLVRGASAISIAYFGPGPDARGSVWQSTWLRRLTLPLLVRVRVELAQSPGTWPDLIVHPRVATGDVCDRDLRTDLCKGAS